MLNDVAHDRYPGAVSGHSWQPAASGPAAIAVHDDGDMKSVL
jgi:hypothetical protein